MKTKEKSEKGVGLPQFFRTLPAYKLPWKWITAAFIFNLVFNQVLLKIPTTTAALLGGSLEGDALWEAVRYYIFYAALASMQAVILRTTENYAVYRGRRSLWGKIPHEAEILRRKQSG